MAGLNSGQVRIAGTGRLLKAALGTALPVDSVAAWGSGFVDLGYADDGFEMKQDLKRKEVNGWQTLELLRLITTALNRSFTFNLKQTNRDTLSLAWGGATITPTPTSLGTVVIAITTGVLTVSAAHSLSIGDAVQLQGVVPGVPLASGVTYYVNTVPTTTTLTLAATLGGALIVTTSAGTATGITKNNGPYVLVIPDAAQIADFIIGIDWSDGVVNQRLVIQRAALLSLPTIKSGRQAEIDYVVEVQALKPADNTNSVLVYGVDVAVGS